MKVAAPLLAALIAYAGKYDKQLYSTLVNGMDAANDVTLLSNIKNKLQLTKLKAGKGARPYSSNFEGGRQGDLDYSGTTLEVEMGKRDLLIEPYKYRDTWMSEVMRPGVNPDDIPFAAYVWDQVIKELQAELNDQTIYFGFDKSTAVAFAAGATYAVGAYITFNNGVFTDYYQCVTNTVAGESPTTAPAKWKMVNAEAICVGFGKRIADAITAGKIVPVATGAVTSADAYGQFTQLWRSMPIPYRKAGANIYASWSLADSLMDDFENKVSKYVEMDPLTGDMFLAKTERKCRIVRATWMTGSGRLICTPKENLLIGTDLLSDTQKINTDIQLRTIEAGIDFELGTQIRDFEAIRVSNVA
jgi:hypothetical protein